MEFSPSLVQAMRDYRLLLDRGYPVKATLALVGDRHRLDAPSRTVLFRGILPAPLSESIAAKILPALPAGVSLGIDGYNVLLTMTNFRRGHPLFVGTDGLLRDAGGAHGRIGRSEDFSEACGLLCARLVELGPRSVVLWLDAPVAGSGGHASILRREFAASGIFAEVVVLPSADPAVRDWEGGAVATSDSGIAMGSRSPVFDLARDILAWRYGKNFPELGKAPYVDA